MISYIGSFLILIALLNASLLVLARPIFSNISTDYDSLILSTSKLQFPLVLIAFLCLIASFVNDDFSGKFGVAEGENVAFSLGFNLSGYYKLSIMENIEMENIVTMYSDY